MKIGQGHSLHSIIFAGHEMLEIKLPYFVLYS